MELWMQAQGLMQLRAEQHRLEMGCRHPSTAPACVHYTVPSDHPVPRCQCTAARFMPTAPATPWRSHCTGSGGEGSGVPSSTDNALATLRRPPVATQPDRAGTGSTEVSRAVLQRGRRGRAGKLQGWGPACGTLRHVAARAPAAHHCMQVHNTGACHHMTMPASSENAGSRPHHPTPTPQRTCSRTASAAAGRPAGKAGRTQGSLDLLRRGPGRRRLEQRGGATDDRRCHAGAALPRVCGVAAVDRGQNVLARGRQVDGARGIV